MRDGSAKSEDNRLARIGVGLFAVLIGLAWVLTPAAPVSAANYALTRFLFLHQDMPIAMLIVAIASLTVRRTSPHPADLTRIAPGRLAVTLAIAMPVMCWIGVRLVFTSFAFSRDEQLANFDATIFASGRLFAPLPQVMRSGAEMFNLTFMLPIGDHEGWVSAYLPVNAAIRALFLRLGDATMTAPVFVALGAIALWRITARLWPESPTSRTAALLLYAGSSQIWITGMTAYAMSAHLGLNLLWLWLFLKDRPWSHGAAIMVGFGATGLHQPLFHPLFVLPFLALLLAARRWRVLLLYCAAYGAIGLFWLGWPLWISGHGAGPAMANASDVSGIGFVERFANAVTGFHLWGIGLMAANLVRFVAWQHLLLLPLAIFGSSACWRSDPVARALAIGIIVPVAILLILFPYQGYGWGYRYLHGVIGNACLLGGYGWRHLAESGRTPVRAMTLATAASIALVLPIHAVMARRMVAPFAAVAARRDATQAQFVIVDDLAAPFARDLVINRPDLSNRPLILVGDAFAPDQIPGLCRQGGVAFLDAAHLAGLTAAFAEPAPRPTARYARLVDAARAARCRIVALSD